MRTFVKMQPENASAAILAAVMSFEAGGFCSCDREAEPTNVPLSVVRSRLAPPEKYKLS